VIDDDFDLQGFDFDLSFDDELKEPDKTEPKGEIKVSHSMGTRQLWRKAASEKALEAAIDWHWQEGDCYHCFSFGDVDSFTFFKMVLR